MLGLTPLRLRWPCGVDRQKAVRFGKSKIHRWGVFAAEALRKDDMLLEYRGEAIGNAVAEIREKVRRTYSAKRRQQKQARSERQRYEVGGGCLRSWKHSLERTLHTILPAQLARYKAAQSDFGL